MLHVDETNGMRRRRPDAACRLHSYDPDFLAREWGVRSGLQVFHSPSLREAGEIAFSAGVRDKQHGKTAVCPVKRGAQNKGMQLAPVQ